MPRPEELFANKGEVLEKTKEFVVELTPKPRDLASMASELTTGKPSEKVSTVALALTPVAILTGAIIVTVGLVLGIGAAGAAGAKPPLPGPAG